MEKKGHVRGGQGLARSVADSVGGAAHERWNERLGGGARGVAEGEEAGPEKFLGTITEVDKEDGLPLAKDEGAVGDRNCL